MLATVWEAATARVIHKIRIPADYVVFSSGQRIVTTIGMRTARKTKDPVNAFRQQVKLPGEVQVWDSELDNELMRLTDGGAGLAFSRHGTLGLRQPGSHRDTLGGHRRESFVYSAGRTRAASSMAFSRDD